MRDILLAIGSKIEMRNFRCLSFHKVVDSGTASSGISWTETVKVLAEYVNEYGAQLALLKTFQLIRGRKAYE